MVPGSGESTGLKQEWRTGRKNDKHQTHVRNIFNIDFTAELSVLDWIKLLRHQVIASSMF